VMLQGAQDLLNMLQMYLLSFVEYADVIQIHNHKRVCEWLQYVIHHLLECGRGISQAERHDHPLEDSFFRLEGCLPNINFLNRHLVLAWLLLDHVVIDANGLID
jgi:hypothetical protein